MRHGEVAEDGRSKRWARRQGSADGVAAASAAAQGRRRARAAGRTARRPIENAAGIYLPDRLHEVRIAVKKLRYALEIVRDLSGSRAAAASAALKRGQDLLGRMHDLEVLIARTRAVQARRVRDLQLSADLDRLVRRLETECRQLHGRYMASRRSVARDSRFMCAASRRRAEPRVGRVAACPMRCLL